MSFTHYIALDTPNQGNPAVPARAICGRYVEAWAQSDMPTCFQCQAHLSLQLAAKDRPTDPTVAVDIHAARGQVKS